MEEVKLDFYRMGNDAINAKNEYEHAILNAEELRKQWVEYKLKNYYNQPIKPIENEKTAEHTNFNDLLI